MKKLIAFAIFALACASFAQNSSVRIDGSSTVYPISLAVAEDFQVVNPDARVTVAFSGTGGGFEKFCNNETDVSNASRIIEQDEIDACANNGIEFIETPVAIDALTVAVNNDNDFVECLSVDELRTMFEPNSSVSSWSDVRAEFPDEPISFYIPGTDSGTFDYFTEAVMGESGASRTDVNPSEDDNVLVRGIEGDPNAVGFFGFAYYVENEDRIKAVSIDNGDGCVEPSVENVENGTYAPLARPLFIYTSVQAADNKPMVSDFATYYFSEDARPLIEDTGYVLLSDEIYTAVLERFESRTTGSAFSDFEPGDDVLATVREAEGAGESGEGSDGESEGD